MNLSRRGTVQLEEFQSKYGMIHPIAFILIGSKNGHKPRELLTEHSTRSSRIFIPSNARPMFLQLRIVACSSCGD